MEEKGEMEDDHILELRERIKTFEEMFRNTNNTEELKLALVRVINASKNAITASKNAIIASKNAITASKNVTLTRLEIQQQQQQYQQQQAVPGSVALNLDALTSSASSETASKERDLYNIFSQPLSPSCYIPNKRLRNLLNDFNLQPVNETVSNYECEFQTLQSSHSYNQNASETRITDPVLKKYFTIVQNIVQLSMPSLTLAVNKDELSIPTYIASNSSKPEYRLEWNNYIVIASEAKGIEVSHDVGPIQGMELGTDGAVYLNQYLDVENAVVPVVLCYGDFIQIFGVYLFGGNFPVITSLSHPISYLDYEGRKELARWTVVLANFAIETINLLAERQQINSFDSIKLSLSYFFKPILNIGVDGIEEYDYGDYGSHRQSCLIKIMNCYQSLYTLNADKYILFPVGVLSYPSGNREFYLRIKLALNRFFQQNFSEKFSYIKYGCPILVFPMLDPNWKKTKPPLQFHLSYLTGVATAIKLMNEARIAHGDFRPSNIMWKVEDEGIVSIQIIDFEDSIPFDIYFQPYLAHKRDKRYPLLNQTDPVQITAFHNYWFLVAIEKWLQSANESFDHFMKLINYDEYKSLANKMTSDATFDPVSYVNDPAIYMNELARDLENSKL